jgi:hypothetical protein
MPLSGFNTLSARPRGGVAKVELIPASEYAGGAPPASSVWAFREDRARYSEEQMPTGALVPLVRHTLEMEFPADPASREAVDELAATARAEGVVAVVTMASGEVIVAGYSSRFAEAYPLRITGRNVTSGRTPADFPTIALTLQSTY